MKKYKEYMDGVKASDTLHQRLVELEAPAKQTIPWKKYSSAAAALILVCGVGGFSVWAAGINSRTNPVPPYPSGCQGTQPEIGDVGQADIAIVNPGDLDELGEKTLGGYDVTIGNGAEAVVAHYILPYIDYGETGGSEAAGQIAADWDIPKGAARRDLTRDEIAALMGGEDAVSTHLDWGGYELTGWAAWYEDGSFWGAYIQGYAGPLEHFEFAVTADQLPPTCIVYPGSVTQEIRGLTVTADGHDSVATPSGGVDASSRRVSFMKDDHGYRFDLTGVSRALTEERVSRLVCRVADEGLALTYDCPYCGHTFPFGAVHNDPAIGADSVVTCSVCGQKFPAGDEKAHVHSFTNETSIPGFVPDYDPTYEDGVPDENSTICGLPLYDPDAQGDSSKDSPRDRGENWCGTPGAGSVGSIAPSLYQSEPPTLRVLCSEGLVDGRSGNYEWSYTDLSSGETVSVTACGPHPLEFRDAPSLTTADGTVILNFLDLPDRVRVDCWPDSEWGSTSAGRQTADAVRGSQTYELTLKDGGWIYEINAEWDDQGTASYVFYLIKN